MGEAPYDATVVRTSAVVGDQLFFTIRRGPGNGGQELWKCGIEPGSSPSFVRDVTKVPSAPAELTDVNGTLFFASGPHLFKSDGTEAGTVGFEQVDDVAHSLTNLNGTLIFTTEDGKLWRSDGQNINTAVIKQLAASNLTVVNGTLYFTTTDGLWKSDGTTAGTIRIYNGTTIGLGRLGGDFYFLGTDATLGDSLFKANISSQITQRVEAVPWSTGNVPSFTAVGGSLFFSAYDTATSRHQLWKTDGTGGGTGVVKPVQSSSSLDLGNLTAADNQLFFTAYNTASGNELWRSDGTLDGTYLVKDIEAGSSHSLPSELLSVGDDVYFRARDTARGYELWKSDGTDAGTQLVDELYAGAGGAYPRMLVKLDQTSLAFQATDETAGYSLFRSDGTSDGTELVSDVIAGGLSSSIRRGATGNGREFLAAGDNSSAGRELYISDGTAAGTTLVKDINTGWNSSDPQEFAAVGNTMFFSAADATRGRELWKSDGTGAGTTIVKDIYTGTGAPSSSPAGLFSYNGMLYFNASDSSGFRQWKTDGTDSGTVKVTTTTGSTLFGSNEHAVLNGVLYFGVSSTLYRTDGTSSGTFVVKSIPNSNGNNIDGLTTINGRLYFSADDGTSNGEEPWISDGTTAGTFMLKNVNPNTSTTGGNSIHSTPTNFVPGNGQVFFVANDWTHGRELWRTDGTAAGTMMVKDIYPSSQTGYSAAGSGIANLATIDGAVVFSAYDPNFGGELWKSDGTETGTFRLRDVAPGSASAKIANLDSIGGKIFFSADDGSASGLELWTTDGSTSGTVLLEDISGVAGGSTPANFTDVNGELWFTANDGVTGPLLYRRSDSTAPEVWSSKVSINSTTQFIRAQFSEDLELAIALQPLIVINQTTGQPVPAASIAVNYETTTNTATWTFPGFTNGVLPDGSYRASVPAGFHDLAGNELVGAFAKQLIWSNGTIDADVHRVQIDAAGQTCEVYRGVDTLPTFIADRAELRAIGFAGQAGNDSVVLDMINGNAFPSDGFSFDGGSGTDTFGFNGSPAAEIMNFSLASVDLGSFGVIPISGVEAFSGDGRGGWDNVSLNSSLNSTTLTFTASQQLQSLDIQRGGVSLAPGGNKVLVTRSLTINGLFRRLDLYDNDLIVDYASVTPFGQIRNWIAEGRWGGTWISNGITSTSAGIANPKNTTLGAMEASDYLDLYGSGATFNGEALDPTMVLVKYTYYGDTDFNGQIDFDDYVNTDFGFNTVATTWRFGDCDGSGLVDFDDFVLLDLAFNTQGAAL